MLGFLIEVLVSAIVCFFFMEHVVLEGLRKKKTISYALPEMDSSNTQSSIQV